jgi:hypothetical protein
MADLPSELTLPTVLASAPGHRAAVLVVDGLSVCCYNRNGGNDRFWEVAYPRKSQHELRIKIWELDGADKPVGQNPKHDIVVHKDVVSFDINLTNGSVAHHGQFPDGGPMNFNFERLDPENDPHDLAWMINLASEELPHGNFLGLKPKHASRPISLARIRHSLFCTLKPEDQPVVISQRRHNNPRHPDRRVLGRTNTELVGVLLAATQSGDIRFISKPAGLLTIAPLPHDQNKRYRIEIINTDTGTPQRIEPFVRGDLHLLYDDVIRVDGEEQELWAFPTEVGRFAPDGDCHATGYGGATLQDLIEP